MPNKGKILLSLDHTKLILKRFALELIEKHQSFDDTAIIGLQPRGIELANALRLEIENVKENVVRGCRPETAAALEDRSDPWDAARSWSEECLFTMKAEEEATLRQIGQ